MEKTQDADRNLLMPSWWHGCPTVAASSQGAALARWVAILLSSWVMSHPFNDGAHINISAVGGAWVASSRLRSWHCKQWGMSPVCGPETRGSWWRLVADGGLGEDFRHSSGVRMVCKNGEREDWPSKTERLLEVQKESQWQHPWDRVPLGNTGDLWLSSGRCLLQKLCVWFSSFVSKEAVGQKKRKMGTASKVLGCWEPGFSCPLASTCTVSNN